MLLIKASDFCVERRQESKSWRTVSTKLGNRYLKSSAATAFRPKKQRRCRLPLLVYESSAAAASECKTAGAAAILKKKKSQKCKGIFIL